MKTKYNKEIDVGIDSSFKSIRTSENNNILYIDKTEVIVKSILKDLNLEGKSFHKAFLGPRRFGKSLTLDVIEHIFNGDRELFEGTYLGENKQKYSDKWWNAMSYPVIKIDFNIAGSKGELITERDVYIDFYGKLCSQLLEQAEKHNLKEYQEKIEKIIDKINEIKNTTKKMILDTDLLFKDLIKEVNKKNNNKGVVVLVDEYDKLATNFIDKPDFFEIIKQKLTDFYSVTKSNKNIKFLFLTGISRMGTNSLLSGMNHIEDLTFTKDLEPLLGISEEELNKYFDLTEEEHDLIKKWYNGYRFVEDNKYIIDETGNKVKKDNSVYCLYSTLHAIKNNKIKNYWISTATPTILVNYLKGMASNGTLKEEIIKELYDNDEFEDKWVNINFLTDSIDIKNYNEDSLYRLLLQTGYLTIKDYNEETRQVLLNYSNLEVKDAFRDLVKSKIYNITETNKNVLLELFKNNKFLEIKDWFKSSFNGINYDIIKKEKLVEGYVHLFFHATLEGSGINNFQSIKGRSGESDLVIMDKKLDFDFLFEFKVKENWDNKLIGIKINAEYEKYILGQCVERGYIDNIENKNILNDLKNEKIENNIGKKRLIVVPVIISKKNGIEDIKFHITDIESKKTISLSKIDNQKSYSFEELKTFYLLANKKIIEEKEEIIDLEMFKPKKK
jgi:hypothetical protein